jgi:hypothetical protein
MKFDQIKKIYFTLTEGIIFFKLFKVKQNKYYSKEIKNNSYKQTIKIISIFFCYIKRLNKIMLEINRKAD